MIEVVANEGYSFENGEGQTQCTGYGEQIAEWRHQAIAEAIDRLTWEQPDNVPYKY